MDSTETPQQPPEESLTLIIKRSSRNIFFAKTILLLGLTLLGGYSFAKDNARQYERGRELTQEKYLEGFNKYKNSLLDAQKYDNPVLATFLMLIVVSFLICSYELTALIIGFMIGKLIRR
jgi:hypothetical protein